MKSGLKIISIALIMLTGISNAYAGPFGRREGPPRARPQPHMNQQEQKQQQHPQFQQPAPQLAPQPPQSHQNPPFPPGPGAQFSGHPFDGRNPGQRMSVEDRQKLRRQINEAGQDIYAQKK